MATFLTPWEIQAKDVDGSRTRKEGGPVKNGANGCFEAAIMAILHHTKELFLSHGFHFHRGSVCLKLTASATREGATVKLTLVTR